MKEQTFEQVNKAVYISNSKLNNFVNKQNSLSITMKELDKSIRTEEEKLFQLKIMLIELLNSEK